MRGGVRSRDTAIVMVPVEFDKNSPKDDSKLILHVYSQRTQTSSDSEPCHAHIMINHYNSRRVSAFEQRLCLAINLDAANALQLVTPSICQQT